MAPKDLAAAWLKENGHGPAAKLTAPEGREALIVNKPRTIRGKRQKPHVPLAVVDRGVPKNIRKSTWKDYALPELVGDPADEPLLAKTRERFARYTKIFRSTRKLRMSLHHGTAHCHKADWLRQWTGFDRHECVLFPGMVPGRPEQVKYNFQTMSAARAMLLLTQGLPEDPKAFATHICGNGHLSCYNPKHLRWGTAKSNAEEKVIHGSPSEFIAGMDPAVVDEVRASPKLVKVLAVEYDLPAGVVSAIRNGEAWASA